MLISLEKCRAESERQICFYRTDNYNNILQATGIAGWQLQLMREYVILILSICGTNGHVNLTRDYDMRRDIKAHMAALALAHIKSLKYISTWLWDGESGWWWWWLEPTVTHWSQAVGRSVLCSCLWSQPEPHCTLSSPLQTSWPGSHAGGK